jgi:NADPH:quinone reductase-like Zn-dependent oxidoreductase
MSIFVQQSDFADPIVLELVDRDEPHPGPGEVRVRVYAAGLNPVDWKLAANARIARSMGLTLPSGFGNDLAGIVDEIGEAVTGFAVGDRVYGGARGRAVAEHVIVSPAKLHHTPEGLDDERAGALESVGLTADAAVDGARLAAEETVLIGGAAGGVGVLAVQLATRTGATVIATASESNHEFLRSLGAVATS